MSRMLNAGQSQSSEHLSTVELEKREEFDYGNVEVYQIVLPFQIVYHVGFSEFHVFDCLKTSGYFIS